MSANSFELFILSNKKNHYAPSTLLKSPCPYFGQRVDLSLKNSMPWLVLAGSGGLADFLSDLLENLSSAPVVQSSSEADGEAAASVDLKDRVAERFKKYFPSEAESDKLVERVSRVARRVGSSTRKKSNRKSDAIVDCH